MKILNSSKSYGELTNEFGVYFHFPFCRHRCSYCDFFSQTGGNPSFYPELIDAQMREIESASLALHALWGKPRKVGSIFLGGGTPSLLPPSLIEKLIGSLRNAFELSDEIEITMEANPESLSPEKVEAFKTGTSINRISMGAQSFQPELLKTLERECSPSQIKKAVGWLKNVGFESLSLDLIFAIPGQSVSQMRDDIAQAVELNVGHLSRYQLTLKPGHPLYPGLPDEDFMVEAYHLGVEALEQAGYALYEISNFSKPGKESIHNLLYWAGGDFLGIGPSAASRFYENGVFWHRKQISDTQRYVQDPLFHWQQCQQTSHSSTQLEALFLELRKSDGIEIGPFESRYGFALGDKREELKNFVDQKWIEYGHGLLKLTPQGRLMADSIALALAP